ncbi:hypothetical protein D3C85_1502270 [compost metagenome]
MALSCHQNPLCVAGLLELSERQESVAAGDHPVAQMRQQKPVKFLEIKRLLVRFQLVKVQQDELVGVLLEKADYAGDQVFQRPGRAKFVVLEPECRDAVTGNIIFQSQVECPSTLGQLIVEAIVLTGRPVTYTGCYIRSFFVCAGIVGAG